MKRILAICTAALVFSCGSTKTKTATTKQAVPLTPTEFAKTITADELKTHLYIYASDEFEGRDTGSRGQKLAVDYLKNEYIKLGVPAAKANGDYFQNVPLQRLQVPDVSLSLDGKAFTYVDDLVSLYGGSDKNISDNSIVFAGYGIDDDNYSDYTNIDVAGKIVLAKAGEPVNADGIYTLTGTTENSKWSNFRQEMASKRDAAKAKGAKALLLYHPQIFPFVAQRFGKSSGRMGLQDTTDEMNFFIINDNLAKAILPEIDTDNNAKAINKSVNLTYKTNAEQFSSENVAAFIKGSEKPNEIIVISAHLDHIGADKGLIFNGADDDGSGTVAVLEIAEAFKTAAEQGQGPKRSILFLHVTGEEKGLLGSRYYTDTEPLFPLENTVADLNIDMVGRTDPKRESTNRNYLYLIGSDKLSTELHEISEAMNTKYCNIEFDYTYNDDNDPNRFYYRSDHYNFAKHNIPVIFYFNGTHDDYHQATDTVDKIQYDLLENRARLIFHTAWELANRDKRIVVDKAE